MNSQPSSHTAHSPASVSEYAERTSSHAEAAAVSVTDTFVHRILGVPGALIGSIQVPDPRPLSQRLNTWHYWWQAHLLECIIDAGQRHLREGRITEAQEQLHRARSLLRGINVRNLGRYANDYFDDMAWLTLAVGRMNSFSIELTGANDVAAQDAGAALFEQLAKGFAPGGGMSWRKSKRNFVNAAATAPAAIAYARAGDPHTAAALMDWMNATLWDAERSLYIDGVNVRGEEGEEHEYERGEYTYNQGTALGALLTLAASCVPCEVDPIEQAERLIVGIVKHMTEEVEFVSGARRRILISHGDGDGGLFTGILVRYLGMAASSPLLSDEARALASSLIYSTARALWEGRREFDPNLPMNELGIDPNEIRGKALVQFSPRFTQATSEALKPGAPVELSTQLQAWTILEAAARLAHTRDIASHRGY